MRQFHARTLFDTHLYEWPCKQYEKFVLIFDDGDTMVTNTFRTEVSRKLWMAHEHYPDLNIYKRHHIGNGPLSNDRLQDVTSAINKDLHDLYEGDTTYDREKTWYLLQCTFQRVYNECIVEYSQYIRGSTSFDFLDLYNYPPIKEIREGLEPNSLSIERGNHKVTKIIMDDPLLTRNPIVSNIRARTVKMEQLLQIILVRGYNTDIDSHIYNKPIMGNYFSGIRRVDEALMESTLAAKSIIFTGQPLEQTEYANRKMQFPSHQVDLLVMNDCGSKKYGVIEITKDRIKDMEGLNFIHPETGKMRSLQLSDLKEFEGMSLKFRLPFYCAYRHQNCICKVCYGDLAYSIPYGTNIGHTASTMTQSEVSQRVLKVKHSEPSTVSDPININPEERPYILPGMKSNEICLNPRLAEKGIKLLLRSTSSQNLINASKLPILKALDLAQGGSAARHTQFKDVTFETPSDSKIPLRHHVSVSRGARLSYLTNDFLRFFLKQGFKIQDDGYYHIDLTEWDFNNPAFELPNRHMNMKDFAAEVEVFIRSTRESSLRHLGGLRQLKQYDDPVEALLDLWELISSKVPVAMNHVAVVMTSMMVRKFGKTGDMRIPPLDEPFRFAKYDEIMQGRSLGALFAYQGGKAALEDIDQYLNTERDPHLMDLFVMPN